MIERPRQSRQSAIRLFAREYYESSLPDGGQGEFDPVFIVTKLGAKVNRMLVAGVIEGLERRDTERGPMYQGSVRDPTGRHMWSVGSFQPELHAEMEELLARFDSGDRFLMSCVGKSNHYQTEDGGFFVRMRLEEYAIIERSTYAAWLIDAADQTMYRIDAWSKAKECADASPDSLREAGVPEHLHDGLLLALGHYPDWDPEAYKVGVLQALSAAEGRFVSFDDDESSSSAEAAEIPSEVASEMDAAPSGGADEVDAGDIPKTVLSLITEKAGEDGLDYNSIVQGCAQRGITDEAAIENAIDKLRDVDCEIIEPRFGWFKPFSD